MSIENCPFVNFSLAGLPPELSWLALASFLGIFQLVVAGRLNNGERGLQWNLGPRDGEPPPTSPIAARMERARANFMESFAFFIVAVVLAAFSDHHNWATVLGPAVYFWARLIYVPLYAFGIFGLRTFIWLIAGLGILLTYLGVLWPTLFG